MVEKKLTTAGGRPYTEFENSITVSNHVPILLQDYFLHKDLAHFNRERILERVVHAKVAGAFGTFNLTNDITNYTNEDLNTFSQNRTMTAYKKKQAVYIERSHPRGVYFIQTGKVKIYRANEDGKEYIIGLHNSGDFFGYTSLIENSLYNDTAETIEDSQIYFIPKEDFFKLVDNNHEVANRFIKMLANNISDMEDRILKLAYNSVRKRVAEALLFIEKTYNKSDQPFSMAISREDVANIVGTSPESVIRVLSGFKDEKLIEIKGRIISIINIEKLRLMKN